MEITEHENFTDKSYQIIIKKDEGLDPFEIAECFKKQYPGKKAVLLFSNEIITVEIGILIIGLNLQCQNKKKAKSLKKEKN